MFTAEVLSPVGQLLLQVAFFKEAKVSSQVLHNDSNHQHQTEGPGRTEEQTVERADFIQHVPYVSPLKSRWPGCLKPDCDVA